MRAQRYDARFGYDPAHRSSQGGRLSGHGGRGFPYAESSWLSTAWRQCKSDTKGNGYLVTEQSDAIEPEQIGQDTA